MAQVAATKSSRPASPSSSLPIGPILTAVADQRSGFDAVTRTFRSLRPAVTLPPPERSPLSVTSFAFSLLGRSQTSDRLAVVDAATGAFITFQELSCRVRYLAAAFHGTYGVSKGDVVFIVAPARVEIPVIYLALLSIGAIVTPANPVATAAELARLVELTRPSVALATSAAAGKLPGTVKVISLDSHEFRAFFDGRLASTWVAVEVWQSDPAAIQFSSGTTGRVKAAALSHRSFISMLAGSYALLKPPQERRSEVTLLAAPMFHSLGFYYALKAVALGETTVLLGVAICGRGGADEMLKSAAMHRATQMTASPPVVSAMARSGMAGRLDLVALRRVVCGGAPLHESEARRFMAKFPGVELAQGYGSTESGGISEMVNVVECRRVTSVGRLAPNVEAKIVDSAGHALLPAGQPGELWVRGPAVMAGYVTDDEANASSFDPNGWLRTGDLCYFDQDGYLYVVDRLKEMIKYKAYQVAPAELESLLHLLPGVADCAVIPYPHEEVGQIPMAYIVRQPGNDLTEGQVMDFVARQVSPYKKIRKVAFVDSIPRSAAGKILRRELGNYTGLRSTSASRL